MLPLGCLFLLSRLRSWAQKTAVVKIQTLNLKHPLALNIAQVDFEPWRPCLLGVPCRTSVSSICWPKIRQTRGATKPCKPWLPFGALPNQRLLSVLLSDISQTPTTLSLLSLQRVFSHSFSPDGGPWSLESLWSSGISLCTQAYQSTAQRSSLCVTAPCGHTVACPSAGCVGWWEAMEGKWPPWKEATISWPAVKGTGPVPWLGSSLKAILVSDFLGEVNFSLCPVFLRSHPLSDCWQGHSSINFLQPRLHLRVTFPGIQPIIFSLILSLHYFSSFFLLFLPHFP